MPCGRTLIVRPNFVAQVLPTAKFNVHLLSHQLIKWGDNLLNLLKTQLTVLKASC